MLKRLNRPITHVTLTAKQSDSVIYFNETKMALFGSENKNKNKNTISRGVCQFYKLYIHAYLLQ